MLAPTAEIWSMCRQSMQMKWTAPSRETFAAAPKVCVRKTRKPSSVISPEAIARLAQRRPSLPAPHLICDGFRTFRSPVASFDYVIALQVFQHGDDADVAAYFARVAALLRPGGLFFLRVNAVSTQIYHAHTVVDRNAQGGVTIRYDDGPKTGLLIHFFSDAELRDRLEAAFVPVQHPREDVTVRAAPKTGAWAQWETICRRR